MSWSTHTYKKEMFPYVLCVDVNGEYVTDGFYFENYIRPAMWVEFA